MTKSREILTVKGVADYLDVHPMTIYKYVKGGKIPAFKIGASWRIRRDSMQRWMEKNEQQQKEKV